MSSLIKHRRVIGLWLVGWLAVSSSAALADHSWDNYHWARTQNPFTVKLGENLSGIWESHLAITSQDWSASAALDTTIVPGNSTARRCRATVGQVEVCNSTYGNNGWLGIASIWASGSHITKASVKLNDTYFNSATYNTPAWRNLVMCQEVGHTFGLDHQDEDFSNGNLNTCMDYTNDPTSNQHPNMHDYEQLLAIYSHVDSTNTASAAALTARMPPAMRDLEINGPGQWGKLIHSSHGGWRETYELDFGRGNKIITHVFWAVDDHGVDIHGHKHH